MPKGYCTKERVAAILGNAGDSNFENEVELFLGAGEVIVDLCTRSRFDNQLDLTRTYSGNGTDMLTLGYFLRSLDRVELVDPGSGEVYSDITSSISLQPDEPRHGCYRWLETRIGAFPEGKSNIKVTGDWGFTTIPEEVQLATAMCIKHIFDYRLVNEFVLTETGNGRMVQMREERDAFMYVPKFAQSILEQLRNSRWIG